MPFILRIGRNKSIWEDGNVDEVIRKAFAKDGQPDLKPSVYVIEPEQLVQACAEHLVSMTNPPVSTGGVDLDCTGLGEPVLVPGRTLFAFTQSAHAELHLRGLEELRALVTVFLREPTRRLTSDAKRVVAYMVEVEANSEWTRALVARPLWASVVARNRPKTP